MTGGSRYWNRVLQQEALRTTYDLLAHESLVLSWKKRVKICLVYPKFCEHIGVGISWARWICATVLYTYIYAHIHVCCCLANIFLIVFSLYQTVKYSILLSLRGIYSTYTQILSSSPSIFPWQFHLHLCKVPSIFFIHVISIVFSYFFLLCFTHRTTPYRWRALLLR